MLSSGLTTTSWADSSGICSAHCMGDAWSAGCLLRAQVRQQGLSWQQPVSTMRPGPGPWQDLTDLLHELLQGRVQVVHLLHKLQVPLLRFLQALPYLISLPGHLLHLLPVRSRKGSITGDTTLGLASRSEGANSSGLRVLSSGQCWALTHLLCMRAKSLELCLTVQSYGL